MDWPRSWIGHGHGLVGHGLDTAADFVPDLVTDSSRTRHGLDHGLIADWVTDWSRIDHGLVTD